MAHVTIEYVILLPLLISQIFLLPWAASIIMNNWVDSRRTLALQETASHLGSSIQQSAAFMNNEKIGTGNVNKTLDVPLFIDGYAYTVTGTYNEGSTVLELTLALKGAPLSVTTAVKLGQNAVWQDSAFMSNSTKAYLHVEKVSDERIELYFFDEEMG
ncbi:MAG: hypothetical protein NWE94_02155 [Candidatus Bathyarchaeota archaeon]|nr:hypothetical protein [Candidatus Bathyarchaeota archaeon]